MAKSRKKTAKASRSTGVELPWDDQGEEITEPGIGIGFVQWSAPGEHFRGIVKRRWQSRRMKAPALTVELTEAPHVAVINTEGDKVEEIDAGAGDTINVSLTHDLDRKLGPDMEGEEVGVLYTGDTPTPRGAMRVYRVVHFDQNSLPF